MHFWHDDSIVAIMGLLACLLAPEPLVGKDNLFFFYYFIIRDLHLPQFSY